MLFLTDVGHGHCEKRQRQTRRQSSYMPPWIYTVLGRRWFRINERNGGSENQSRRQSYGRVKRAAVRRLFFFCRRAAGTLYSLFILILIGQSYFQVTSILLMSKMDNKKLAFQRNGRPAFNACYLIKLLLELNCVHDCHSADLPDGASNRNRRRRKAEKHNQKK